jgi:Glyoxalase-like domain
MACRPTEIVVDSRDPARLAAWWAEVLGYRVTDPDGDGAIEIGPPGASPHGPVPTLVFVPVPEPTPGKARLHLDLNATDRPQAAELERLLGLGARRADVGQTGEESWVVLADPEDNEFCLLASTVAPLP